MKMVSLPPYSLTHAYSITRTHPRYTYSRVLTRVIPTHCYSLTHAYSLTHFLMLTYSRYTGDPEVIPEHEDQACEGEQQGEGGALHHHARRQRGDPQDGSERVSAVEEGRGAGEHQRVQEEGGPVQGIETVGDQHTHQLVLMEYVRDQ